VCFPATVWAFAVVVVDPCVLTMNCAAFGYASVGVSESSRLIVKSTFGERLPPEAGAGYTVKRARPSDAGAIAALSALDSSGRAATLVRTEDNIAARLRGEAWDANGSGWGIWGACPHVVWREKDDTAVGFLVLRKNVHGPHSPLSLGPLAASAPSWNADNIGRGAAAGMYVPQQPSLSWAWNPLRATILGVL
jgi:hypothetical protein